jgi:hypothetical protein
MTDKFFSHIDFFLKNEPFCLSFVDLVQFTIRITGHSIYATNKEFLRVTVDFNRFILVRTDLKTPQKEKKSFNTHRLNFIEERIEILENHLPQLFN